MAIWKIVLISIFLLVGAWSCNKQGNKNKIEACESKLFNSLPTINDTIGFTKLSNTADTSNFSVSSKLDTETISLFYKQDSVCFRFKNETIVVPVAPEHQYHKRKSNPNLFFLNQYLSLGFIEVHYNGILYRIHKIGNRVEEFGPGYSVFYSIQHGFLAISHETKIYWQEHCHDEFISLIKKYIKKERYFFDVDSVLEAPPVPPIMIQTKN